MAALRFCPALARWMLLPVVLINPVGTRGIEGQQPPPPQHQTTTQPPEDAGNTAQPLKSPQRQNPTGILHLPADLVISPDSDPAPNPDTIDAISRQIQGHSDAKPGETDSRQPIPEGLLELMKINGSVVDGTALDPETEFLPKSFHDVKAGRWQPAGSQRPDHNGTKKRLRAAEALLKASRLLENLSPPDLSNRQLVEQMRRQAATLIAAPTPTGDSASAPIAKPQRFLKVTIADSPEPDHNQTK